jgi:hypothetical protein
MGVAQAAKQAGESADGGQIAGRVALSSSEKQRRPRDALAALSAAFRSAVRGQASPRKAVSALK